MALPRRWSSHHSSISHVSFWCTHSCLNSVRTDSLCSQASFRVRLHWLSTQVSLVVSARLFSRPQDCVHPTHFYLMQCNMQCRTPSSTMSTPIRIGGSISMSHVRELNLVRMAFSLSNSLLGVTKNRTTCHEPHNAPVQSRTAPVPVHVNVF